METQEGITLGLRKKERHESSDFFFMPLVFEKNLTSRTQPLILKTQFQPEFSNIVTTRNLLFTLMSTLSVFIALIIIDRFIGGIRRAELKAKISEQETKIVHASRVNALGEMASGMAHELTQPLTAILSQSQAGLRLFSASGVENPVLKEIFKSNVAQSKRAAEIIKRFRDWSKSDTSAKKIVDVNQCINNVTILLDSKIKKSTISIDTILDPANPMVWGDNIAIEQVVYNLIQNAVESLEQGVLSGAEPTVQVRSNVRDDHIAITVTDNGPGISPKIRDRLFEPFATSKSHGVGLGLALCERIVNKMDGSINIETAGVLV